MMTKSSILKSDTSWYKHIIKKVKSVSKHPEDFLSVQELKCEKIRSLVKETYDFACVKDSRNNQSMEMLSKLVVEEMDEEQIWQLIELRNNILLPQFVENASKLLSLKADKYKIIYSSKNLEKSYENNTDNENADGASEVDDRPLDQDHEEFVKTKKWKSKKNEKKSIVDDEFFKLREMEAFLIAEDEKEICKKKGKFLKDDITINYFGNNLDSSEEENINYKDFFDDDGEEVEIQNDAHDNTLQYEEEVEIEKEERLKSRFPENENDNEEDSGNEQKEFNSGTNLLGGNQVFAEKSSFEHREERLKQRIRDYEEDILGEKPWQLKGEVTATTRPQNSLLEEILEFESTTRPSPIVTETTNIRLEDIIRQRIKSQAWDDVELKIKPLNTPREYRKQLVLDQEKSKESLAQIYEKEYQREIEKMNPNASKEEEPKSHKDIKILMHSLFIKLDALSNFHFTPKPVLPEPKIITNTPAINLEEVAPIAVSDAKLLAPEEIRKRTKGDILGSNERSKTDKNRDRRHKKQKQRAIHKAMEERDIEKQKLGLKLTKREEQVKLTKSLVKSRQVNKGSISKDTGAHKSSTAFFTKLQETTMMQAKPGKRPNKTNSDILSAKKLKL